jgi:hypothetical protein
MTAAKSVTATFNVGSALGDALDNNALTWTTFGSAAWASQNATTFDGIDAARSGLITDTQVSTLRTTVTGPGQLAYRWKVSSESGWDFLTFVYDGFDQSGPISGEVDWTQLIWNIPAGTHTIDWRYSKDGTVSAGSDAGFVDQVTWTPGATAGGGSTPQLVNSPKPKPLVPKK